MNQNKTTSVADLNALGLNYSKFKGEMTLLGTRYQPESQKIPWAEFLMSQFSYWGDTTPFPCPHFIKMMSPDCDFNVSGIFETAQDVMDGAMTPYDFMRDLAHVGAIGDKIRERRTISPTNIDAREMNGCDIKELLLGFRQVRRRPFAAAHTKATGVIHDGMGFVQLVTRGSSDILKLCEQLSSPSWLSSPEGRFIMQEDLAPVKVAINGFLPVPLVGPAEWGTLFGGPIPGLVTAGPDNKAFWSDEERRHFLESSEVLAASVQATRIQKGSPNDLRATNSPQIDWFGIGGGHSPELQVEFWRIFGKLSQLSEGQRKFLVDSWCSCRRFAERFCMFFLPYDMKERGIELGALQANVFEGLDQLFKRHIKISNYLNVTAPRISEVEWRILKYLRNAWTWKSGREIQRGLTKYSSSIRDASLKQLHGHSLVRQSGKHWCAVPLGEYCSFVPSEEILSDPGSSKRPSDISQGGVTRSELTPEQEKAFLSELRNL